MVGVGDFASAGFASAVAHRVRMAELTAAQGGHLLNLHDGWIAADAGPLAVEPAGVRVASTFVRRSELGLRALDALRAAVRNRLGLPLLTFDERQAAAAERLGVGRASTDPAED